MKKSSHIPFILGIIFAIVIWISGQHFIPSLTVHKPNKPRIVDRHLERYSFENLKKTHFPPSSIRISQEAISDEPTFTSRMFYFDVEGRKVSGLMNLPKSPGNYPVIVLVHGYVDPKEFSPGTGSMAIGQALAKSGYITLAPDFFGYGESDKSSDDSLEDRFQTYTTMLSLLASIDKINEPLSNVTSNAVSANTNQVGIWGHSNGGHIALATLALSGGMYPTVLWNPVSAPFPYSILKFATEGYSPLHALIDRFKSVYDIEKYSPPNYYSWIKTPVELHQGDADIEVPKTWSDKLFDTLKRYGDDITYYTYEGENHHFTKGSWNTVATRSIEFYKDQFANSLAQK